MLRSHHSSQAASESLIAVVGAAGISGGYVLRALETAQCRVRAVVHSKAGAEKAAAAGAAETAEAELGDPRSLAAALVGVSAVYMIPPSLHPDETTFAINTVRAAESGGATRFVYVSVMHPHTPSMRHHMRKAAAEIEVRNSSLSWTILQPAMYAQMVCLMFGNGPAGPARVPFNVRSTFSTIDLRELAEVAVKALTESGHEFAAYELCSSTLTMADMVLAAGAARGVILKPESIDPDQAPLPPRFGADSSQAADLRAMFKEYDRHGLRGNNRVLRSLLEREPASFATVAQDVFKRT